MLRKTCYRTKGLSTLTTFYLHTTIGMHSFMATKIGKLGITFVANFTSKGFYTAVDMCMLLETRTGCKCLATLRTCMASSSNMVCAYMSLEVAWISENFVAVFAWKSSILSMNHFMAKKVGTPGEALVAMLAAKLTWFVTMCFNHMII